MGELTKWLTTRRPGSVKVDKELLHTEFEPKCVICNETGHVYTTAQVAADMNGFSYMRMKRHLEGEVPFLRFHGPAILTFSYTDLKVDELGNIIKPNMDSEGV